MQSSLSKDVLRSTELVWTRFDACVLRLDWTITKLVLTELIAGRFGRNVVLCHSNSFSFFFSRKGRINLLIVTKTSDQNVAWEWLFFPSLCWQMTDLIFPPKMNLWQDRKLKFSISLYLMGQYWPTCEHTRKTCQNIAFFRNTVFNLITMSPDSLFPLRQIIKIRSHFWMTLQHSTVTLNTLHQLLIWWF